MELRLYIQQTKQSNISAQQIHYDGPNPQALNVVVGALPQGRQWPQFQDPQFEELQIADCRPAERIITNRTVTFQDRIAVEIPAVTGPTPAPANPFYDYDFWKDKRTKRALLRYMFVFCDGTIMIPRDESGKPMAASFDVFLSYERQGSGGNSYILEIKKGQLDFKGDPLDFNIPALDVSTCDFSI